MFWVRIRLIDVSPHRLQTCLQHLYMGSSTLRDIYQVSCISQNVDRDPTIYLNGVPDPAPGFGIVGWREKNCTVIVSVFNSNFLKGGFFGFFLFMYDFRHCFICRPSDTTVSEDAGIEPRTVVTTVLAVRRSNHSARYHPNLNFLYLLYTWMKIIC